MTIKHVFTDVDSTLVGLGRDISKKDIDTINKVRSLGIGFYLISGRVRRALFEILDPLNMNYSDNEYIICANGAFVSDTNGQCLFANSISKDNVLKLIDCLKDDRDNHYIFGGKDYYYSFGKEYEYVNRKYEDCKNVSVEKMIDLAKNIDFYKLWIEMNNTSMLKEISTKIIQATNYQLTTIFSGNSDLEAINKNVSKGDGLKRFCELKGIDLKDVLVIGDNYNDESSISIAGYKACPSNAIDVIKKQCDYISKYDCRNNAVSDILEKMILNK